MSDNTAVNHYYHRSKTDTLEDVLRPGFFNFMKENFRSGKQKAVVHLVSCYLGEIEDGLTIIDLNLVDAPAGQNQDVLMAQTKRFDAYKKAS